ncbi:Hypothetical_protein [Hexamita inflata]|uniref:Hypothetical_protein n=1 Tax=Hexamita inflata TaxID=28002 RepID=A0AA86VA25_9EUKA|nr:Hypothetical protein HINF_LOCUS48333 [Hexamita inflata]
MNMFVRQSVQVRQNNDAEILAFLQDQKHIDKYIRVEQSKSNPKYSKTLNEQPTRQINNVKQYIQNNENALIHTISMKKSQRLTVSQPVLENCAVVRSVQYKTPKQADKSIQAEINQKCVNKDVSLQTKSFSFQEGELLTQTTTLQSKKEQILVQMQHQCQTESSHTETPVVFEVSVPKAQNSQLEPSVSIKIMKEPSIQLNLPSQHQIVENQEENTNPSIIDQSLSHHSQDQINNQINQEQFSLDLKPEEKTEIENVKHFSSTEISEISQEPQEVNVSFSVIEKKHTHPEIPHTEPNQSIKFNYVEVKTWREKTPEIILEPLEKKPTETAPMAASFKAPIISQPPKIQHIDGLPIAINIENYSDTVSEPYKVQISPKQVKHNLQFMLMSTMPGNRYQPARSSIKSTQNNIIHNIEIKFSEVDLGKMFDLLVNIDGAIFAMPLTYKPLSKEGQLPMPNAQAIPAQLVLVEEQQLTPVTVTFGEQVQIVQKKQVLFTAPLESCDVYTAPSQKNLFSFFADEQVSLHSAEYLRLKTLLKVNFGDAFSLTSEEFFGPAFSKLKESTKLQTDCVALLEFNSALAVVKLESEAQLQRLGHQVCAPKQLLFAKQDEARKKKVQSYQFDLSQITLQQFLQQKQQNEVKIVSGAPVFQKPTDFKVLYLQGGCVARISDALDLNCQHAVWVLTEDKSFQVKVEDKPITNISQKVHVWLDGQWKSFQMKNGQLAVKKKTYSLALNKSVSWQRYIVIGSGHSSALVDLGEDIRRWAVFQNVI